MKTFLSALLIFVMLSSRLASQPSEASSGQIDQTTAADVGLKLIEQPVDYYDGLRAWENGQKEVAVSLWIRASEYGDVRSLNRVGNLYRSGIILPQDEVMAAYYKALANRLSGFDQSDPYVGVSPEARSAVTQRVDAFVPKSLRTSSAEATLTDPQQMLIRAIYDNDLRSLDMAIDRGASPTLKSDEGWPALFHAASVGNLDVIAALLKLPITLYQTAGESEFSVLHVAAFNGSIPLAEALIAAGAHPLAETTAGMRPSDVAEAADHVELASFLREQEVAEAKKVQEKLNNLGYDVGKADGVIGQQSRMQLAIFANSAKIKGGRTWPHVLSPLVLTLLEQRRVTSVWGARITYDDSDSVNRLWYAFEVNGDSEADARANALELCKAQEAATKCEVKFVFPSGGCLAVAEGSAGGVGSRIFASIEDARMDALERCNTRQGGSCKIHSARCVGE